MPLCLKKGNGELIPHEVYLGIGGKSVIAVADYHEKYGLGWRTFAGQFIPNEPEHRHFIVSNGLRIMPTNVPNYGKSTD
ncbi:MAG: hypothetical protein Q8Q18_03140 [bacterium]|nr:hypothetical protein [bacterium]